MEEELEDRGRMAPERKRPSDMLGKLSLLVAGLDLNFLARCMISINKLMERLIRESKAREREAMEREAMEREAWKQLMCMLNLSPGNHITYRLNNLQRHAIVEAVDYRARTLTIIEFSDGKLQRKTHDFSAEEENYRSDLPFSGLTFTGSIPSWNQGYIEQSLSQNTQSFKDPHAIDTMCNLLSNSSGHYELNCESQSQKNKRTTYDKYNRPIGAKRLSDQQQSEKLHEQTERDKSQCEIASNNPDIISNSVTRQIQSSTLKALLMPSSLQSPVQEHLALHSETHDQTKSDELLFEILCRALSQSSNNETHQMPSRTSKTLLATLCLQSTVSKFNIIMISKEVSVLVRAAPRTVLPSRALLVAMFVAAAMLPYIALLVGNLTSVQRTYAGLWRPNELCDYCINSERIDTRE